MFCHWTGRHISHILYVLSPDRKEHYTYCTFYLQTGRNITHTARSVTRPEGTLHILHVLSADWKEHYTYCTFCHQTGRNITHTARSVTGPEGTLHILYVLSLDRKAHYTYCTFCHWTGRNITHTVRSVTGPEGTLHTLYVLSLDRKAHNFTVQRSNIRFFSSPVTVCCWLHYITDRHCIKRRSFKRYSHAARNNTHEYDTS